MKNHSLFLAGACAALLPVFSFAQNIDAYRYWIDDDAAAATTVTVPSTPVLALATTLPTSALTVGSHKVSMHFRDTNGAWSVITETYFTKSGAPLSAWQYWFDDNVAALVETPVAPGAVINVLADIDASALAPGMHNLTWRMRDAMGNWSVPVSQDFDLFTVIDEVPDLGRVLLFPNPASERAVIRFEDPVADLLYDVVDAAGRVVIPVQRATVASRGTLEMSIEGWPSGTYQLRLTGNNGVRVVPFVKQ